MRDRICQPTPPTTSRSVPVSIITRVLPPSVRPLRVHRKRRVFLDFCFLPPRFFFFLLSSSELLSSELDSSSSSFIDTFIEDSGVPWTLVTVRLALRFFSDFPFPVLFLSDLVESLFPAESFRFSFFPEVDSPSRNS